MSLSRLTLKIAIPLFTLLLLMILMAGAVLVTQSVDRDAIQVLKGSIEKQTVLASVERHYTRLLMAENSYALSGKHRYAEDFAVERQELEKLLTALDGLTLTAVEQEKVAAFREGFARLTNEVELFLQEEDTRPVPEVQRATERLDNSVAISLADDLGAFSEAVEMEVRDSAQQIEAADAREFWFALIPVVIAIPIGIVVVFLTLTRISRPLLRLVEMAEKITMRDFSTRMRTASEDEIGKLTRAFNAMAEEIERRYDELESFAYIVAHDLKNPISGIRGLTEIVLEGAKARLNDEEKESLDTVLAASDSMNTLITDLLEFARAGKIEFTEKPVPMNQLLDQITHELTYTTKERGARIVVEENLPALRCDPVRYAQVWKNLLSNALKYNDKPEPVVTISCTETGSGFYHFEVADNGIGLDPADYESIFHPFKRAATEQRYEGTGIGLAIVKRVVDFHGGRVWVTSRKGEGTTFHFTAPKLSSSATPPAA